MRRLREFDGGASVEYTYNAAGSLTEIQIKNPDGTISGQRLTLDETQKVRLIERPTGGDTHLTYDTMGNLTSATTQDQTLRYSYDRLNRLTEIVTPEGRRLHYRYREGEPDLRLQMDHHTGRTLSERMTSGLTFSSGLELLKNRTEGSALGVIRFDTTMMDYRLASDDGVVLPDAVPASAMARIRVMDLGQSAQENKKTFDAPSNVLFIPAEYWAVNCCICGFDLCFFVCEPGADPCQSCCTNCNTSHAICNNTALAVLIAAEAACAAGVCTTQGPDSPACIACLSAALAVYLIQMENCDLQLQNCKNSCAITHPGCQCP
jgi:YD repeat-containing protein